MSANSIRKNNEKAYELLKDVISIAYGCDVQFFTPPYENIKMADHGLREMMWENFDMENEMPDWLNIQENISIAFIIHSNLGFYNVIFLIKSEDVPDVISIGPIRGDDLSPRYFEQIMKDAHLSSEKMRLAESIFRQLPQGNPQDIFTVASRIICEYVPSFEEIEAQVVEFKNEPRPMTPSEAKLQQEMFSQYEKLQALIKKYQKFIKEGDVDNARTTLHELLQSPSVPLKMTLTQQKNFLMGMNTMALTALLQTSVHPTRIFQLYQQLSRTISDSQDAVALSYMPYDICHKSCLLVRNYANSEYSYTTRQVMDYVAFHLEEDLSLAAIAENFGRNASTLSHQFHKEVGETLSDYVAHCRVREAVSLFNTTDATVSEVAMAVGYEDFAYFSRVFKKHMKMSPRSYKKYMQGV